MAFELHDSNHSTNVNSLEISLSTLEHIGTCDELPSDLKSAVFKIVLRAGGKSEFE